VLPADSLQMRYFGEELSLGFEVELPLFVHFCHRTEPEAELESVLGGKGLFIFGWILENVTELIKVRVTEGFVPCDFHELLRVRPKEVILGDVIVNANVVRALQS